MLNQSPVRGRAAVLALSSALALMTSTSSSPSSADRSGQQSPSAVVVMLEPLTGTEVVRTIPPEAYSQPPAGEPERRQDDGAPPRAIDKLHPILLEQLGSGLANEAVELVVTFADQLRIPRFPQLPAGERPDSPRAQAALAEAARLVGQIRALRAPSYQTRAEELAPLDVQVTETFWLLDAMLVRMPLSAVEALAEREDVRYIEPNRTSIPPPNHDGNPNNDVADARAYIRTDGLAAMWTGGVVGLLDTGVRASHTLFTNPSPLRHVRDCVNGTANNCTTGSNLNPDDNCWNHGTSTAAIITGNSNLGNDYRGVDWITLDSYKVYDCPPLGLNDGAVLRGFQAAVAALDQVIVAEMQGTGSDSSSISIAADNAYDAGVIVVAANGNFGPGSGTVRTPANAHKALGIGAFDVETLVQTSSQSLGPAPDGRIKPDLQSPTNTETASTVSSTALQIFGGTSGATPYASGLAIGLRNWISRTGGSSFLPGIGYAWMILMGQNVHPFNNSAGAGHARFVPNGILWQALVPFTGAGTTDIPLDTYPFDPSQYPYNLTAAIWWPEAVGDTHNDVDLHIVDPSGVVRASSTSGPSVFERARIPGPLASGVWKARVHNKGSRAQNVYLGAFRTTSP